MASIQFVLQPLPGSDEQYLDRLREVSDKVNKFGFGTHRVFDQLKIPVKEVVIGPNHIGILLEDGKAFRVVYSINSDRLDLSKNDASKNNNSGSNSTSTSTNSKSPAPSNSRQLARSRARLMRPSNRSNSGTQGSGSRSTGVIIAGGSSSRPLVTVPATYVPEELISQAEVVLQGKSRNLIIRELQRTNLDVNLAVNNLLSRDDEDAEDTEEGGDNYVPEDLISLLDNGFHGDNNSVIIDPSDGLFTEEIFSNYSSIRNLLFDRIRSERSQANTATSDSNQSRSSSTGYNVLAGANSLSAQISSVSAEREAFSRWRDRQYYVPRRWPNMEEYVWDKDNDSKKKDLSMMSSPIWISEEPQPWPDKGNTLRFKRIAALYSEFIAVSESGELHQWKWSEAEPYKSESENVFHPKTLPLNISEKVEHISANFIRCSVVTASDRVATWMDEQLGYIGAKLEHAAILFNEFILDPIVSLNVCSLYTAVRTENNIYWWGVLPFDQRRYLWDKYKTKTKKNVKSVISDLLPGTQVIMKKCPKYQAGSIGFTCANGVPKVGQLLNSIWDANDVCRCKILNVMMTNTTTSSLMEKSSSSSCSGLSTTTSTNSNNNNSSSSGGVGVGVSSMDKEINKPSGSGSSGLPSTSALGKSTSNKETTDRIDMPPPPSPASSTCSDTGSVTSHKRTKRMATKDEPSSSSSDSKKDEEIWLLKDVVFVEDKIGPIGKVLKVDGDFVAVRFPVSSMSCGGGGASGNDCKEDDWQQCRLLRRDDVQIYKTAVISRGPEWLQKSPKKININHGNDATAATACQLLSMAVDLRGIHVIKRVGQKLHYCLYNLYNSKQEQNCQFPTDCYSFVGASLQNISMICNNDSNGNSSTICLRDGNGALYPMTKDCMGSIKDPQWLDLPPVKTVAMATISLGLNNNTNSSNTSNNNNNNQNNNNKKSKVCVTALLFESQKLMPHILRCDVKNAFAILNRYEKSDKTEILSIIEERCDGARNIFHACVIMCSPTTNKDTEEKKVSNVVSSRTSPAAASSVAAAAVAAAAAAAVAAGVGVSSGGSGGGSGGGGGAVFPASTQSLSASTESGGGNANNTPIITSAFSVVSTAMVASSISSSHEGRTVCLRELNRLINSDLDQAMPPSNNSSSAMSGGSGGGNVEESAVYVSPWAMESNVSNASTSSVGGGGSGEEATGGAAGGTTTTNLNTDDDQQRNNNNLKVNAPNYVFDPIHRREHATLILQQMCSCSALRPYLFQLLSARDAQGQTPFMLAVNSRAYEAGLILLKTILALSEKDSTLRDAMIFPPGSPPDQSPLYVICYNDTCSFTWTGADHINQNIFECKTCGLTDSLCCCTECARVCHKGHDCKLKRTSPTAYCDCWEKCKCKALIAGNQTKRFSLLSKLASCTDLVTRFNSKGESILLFLIQTVGRQAEEQRQYRANARMRNMAAGGGSGGGGGGGGGGSNSGNGNVSQRKVISSNSSDMEVNMPDHDLEPPKFARRALERLLIDWNAVRSMIMTGAEKCESLPQQMNLNNSADISSGENYNVYWQNQQGSTLLDKFTHNLFVKCSSDHLETLLVTLVREMQNDNSPNHLADAEFVARRFVRSVARVFVIFNLEKFPNPERRKSMSVPHKHIQTCIKVFQSLHKIAIQELCEVSEALIAPVRLGVVRPTAPFMASSNIENSDDLFGVDPMAPFLVSESANEISPTNNNNESHHHQGDHHHQSSGGGAGIGGFQSNYGIEGIVNIQDSAENEEMANRGSIAHNQDEDMMDAVRNDEAMQDDESDNEYTFNEPETESDSDDNQSNQDAQRSVQTGATVGSETDLGVLFLEDESGESSAQDEEGSDEGETDDHDDDEFTFTDQQLERRNANSNGRSELAPQNMQWAIRNRDTARNTVRMPTGSSLIFIDPMVLRRSTVPSNTSVATSPQEHFTMATTASNLARGFGIIVRQISELLSNISYNAFNDIELSLKIKSEEAGELQTYVERHLKRTWNWMFSVMDSTEAQLKFGTFLTNYTDPTHPLHPLNLSAQNNQNQSNNNNNGGNNPVGTSRRDFFTYCLSLMRAHTSEHRDSLPVLDITAQRHIAFVLDAFIYYMRNDSSFYEKNTLGLSSNIFIINENEDTDDELSNITSEDNYNDAVEGGSGNLNSLNYGVTRRSSFFVRSDSTLSLGCLAPEGFDLSLDVAIPLADKPHLLQPNSKRQDLFANFPLAVTTSRDNNMDSTTTGGGGGVGGGLGRKPQQQQQQQLLEDRPTKLGFFNYTAMNSNEQQHQQQSNSTTIASSTMINTNSTSTSTTATNTSVPMEEDNANNVENFDEMKGTAATSASTSTSNMETTTEGSSNVYLQFKKKHYNEDTKMVIDNSNNTNTNTNNPEKLDNTTNVLNSSHFNENVENLSGGGGGGGGDSSSNPCNLMMTRPDIIIAPPNRQRSMDAGGEPMQIDVVAVSSSSSSSSHSMARSVIVRAGTNNNNTNTTSSSSSTATLVAKDSENNLSLERGDNNNILLGQQSSSSSSSTFVGDESLKTTIHNSNKMMSSLMPVRGQHLCQNFFSENTPSWNFLLGRWKLTLELFGRVFMDDVGMEHGSVLPELRGFPVKEMRFRRHMEKLRTGQQRDLILCKLERNRDSLIIQTFKELNTQFGNQNKRVHPPPAFNRVKVTFKDEPGEGSGVARSFYTSISEALLASTKIPNLESAQVGNSNSSGGNNKYGVPFSSILRNRSTSGRDPPTLQRRGTGSKILWRTARERKTLNYDARPYTPASNNSGGDNNSGDNSNDHLTMHLQQLGERLYSKICIINPTNAAKITGMLLEMPSPQLLSVLSSEDILRQKVEEAMDIIKQKMDANNGGGGGGGNSSKKLSPVVMLEPCNIEDNEPLFYTPGKRGFYTPRQGYGTAERINAFRNIGRLIGLCLLQNELLPLYLQRHVLKYILGRRIKFHDLAFFDPSVYESFRQLIQNSQLDGAEESIARMELFFSIDLMKEEGGGSIELIPGGREIQVNTQNLFDYIKRYTEYRLIKTQDKALEALRDGVFDVLPETCLQSLTSEDLRLLLNGVGDIDVTTLISYTTFNDESNEGSDKLLKFKRWFWSIVEKMNAMERQDLVYFWTGSPALPASEEGFQPLPSVTIRPADDTHLPTANTCISRLYIPLYSSKSILRGKLLLAIKSKNFGFV